MKFFYCDWFDEIAKKSRTTHEHVKFDLCQSSLLLIRKKLYIPQTEFVPTIERSKQCMQKSTHSFFFREKNVFITIVELRMV